MPREMLKVAEHWRLLTASEVVWECVTVIPV
jgi:hypothetical protein